MKLLAHLAPRRDAQPALAKALDEAAARLAARAPHGVERVAAMHRLAGDPFGPATPYGAALELRAAAGAGAEALVAAAAGLDRALGDALDAARSTALVGEERVFVAGPPTPERFQYLMRRRPDWSREDYLRYYAEHHSRFGHRTPGLRGYVQVHVDPAASARAAASSGLGVFDVDSVSELHFDSLAGFLAALEGSSIGDEANADEERFVDRSRSHAFCTDVVWYEPGRG